MIDIQNKEKGGAAGPATVGGEPLGETLPFFQRHQLGQVATDLEIKIEAALK